MRFSTNPDSIRLYVVPHPDELLSSWLIRNALNSKTFATEYFSRWEDISYIWYQDIDRSLPDSLINIMHETTPYSIDEITSLSLKSYEGVIFENDNSNAVNKWIRQIKFKGRVPQNEHVSYCPKCMNSKHSYFKREWRLKLFNVCLNCGVFLETNCPKCDMPIHFFRNSVGKTKELTFQMNQCYNCKSDISNRKIIDAPEKYIESTLFFKKTLESKTHHDFNYSFIYFDCLYQVNKIITNNLATNRLIDTKCLAQLLHISYWLLLEFPHNLALVSRNRKISKTVWLKDFHPDRFHFTSEITKHLSKLRLTQFD